MLHKNMIAVKDSCAVRHGNNARCTRNLVAIVNESPCGLVLVKFYGTTYWYKATCVISRP